MAQGFLTPPQAPCGDPEPGAPDGFAKNGFSASSAFTASAAGLPPTVTEPSSATCACPDSSDATVSGSTASAAAPSSAERT